jgi:hypothetical protein
MSAHPVRRVSIRLTDLHDLFTQPQPGSARPVSGMQELYDVVQLQTRFLTRPCAYQVTLELPAEQITAGLADGSVSRSRTTAPSALRHVERICSISAIAAAI